jgi:hypothetical protein
MFYNQYGAGDLFETRRFVQEIINLFPGLSYMFAHAKGEEVLKDLPIIYVPITSENSHLFLERTGSYVHVETRFINTWIGRDSQYVLPNVGCVVEQSFRMFNDILRIFSDKQLPGVPYDYVPNIDYSFYKTDWITNVASGKKVLICNGPVQSCQAENFDFTPVINFLAHNFQNVTFYITSNMEIKYNNVVFTGDLIKKNGFDLNEVALLSSYCDVIVGRKSGPFCFCGTKDNWENPNKTFISFTYGKEASSFVSNQVTKAKKVWSPSTNLSEIESIIAGEL